MSEFNVDEGWEFEDWRKNGFYGFVRNDSNDEYFIPSFMKLDSSEPRYAGISWDTVIFNTKNYVETGNKKGVILTDLLMIPADSTKEQFKPFMETLLPKVRMYSAKFEMDPNRIFATKYPEKVMRTDPSTNELMELCLAAEGLTMMNYWNKVNEVLNKIQNVEVKEIVNWAYPF